MSAATHPGDGFAIPAAAIPSLSNGAGTTSEKARMTALAGGHA